LAIVLVLLGAPLLAPARAQESVDAKAAQVMENARKAIGPISPEERRKACRAQTKENEIVVCAPDDKEFRVQSTNEVDPTSRQATRDGMPHAPKLDGEPCDIKLITCFGLGRAREAMIMIDLGSIPETPPGSDAEKIGNGEMRRR
jgi:hypothetical protein